MAIIKNGIISGKVGSKVYAYRNDQQIVQSLPKTKRLNNSPKQMIQKAKFGLATSFVKQLADLYDITYRLRAEGATARNIAVGDIMANAITGEYPDFSIDYSKLLISTGNLLPESASITIAAGRITWKWEPNMGVNGAEPNDQSIVVAYCPEMKKAIFRIHASARCEGAAILDVRLFAGYKVVTYLGFTSLNQRRISNSQFTGELQVN